MERGGGRVGDFDLSSSLGLVRGEDIAAAPTRSLPAPSVSAIAMLVALPSSLFPHLSSLRRSVREGDEGANCSCARVGSAEDDTEDGGPRGGISLFLDPF